MPQAEPVATVQYREPDSYICESGRDEDSVREKREETYLLSVVHLVLVKGIERMIWQFLMMIVIHQMMLVIHQLLMKQEKHPSKLTELIQLWNHP